jgi:hypothetical protein
MILMRHQLLIRCSFFASILFTLFSCSTEKEEFITDEVKDYILMTPGKYITYRLDSLVFTNFGRTIDTHRYRVKEQVDALITDNLGRPSYRVFRYITDSLGIGPWQPSGTYFVTPLTDQIEVVEDNLRTIKLHMPIRDNFSWKGNRYYPSEPYYPQFPFNNDISIQDWDFYYNGGSSTFSYRGNNYADVYTVEEADDLSNVPITSPGSYASKTRAVEMYSKNIGLVYREYELWDYQPNTGLPGGPYYTGFGIRKWMIEHN